MKASIRATLVLLCLLTASAVSAKTPDGLTPSRETVCDNEQGAAYGLCTSYCEAKDCGDPNQRASNRGCESVRRNFERKTGRPIPCAVNCPCADMLQLFELIENNEIVVTRCILYPELLYVLTETGDEALIDNTNNAGANCNVNQQPPFVPLNPTELQVCRVRLREAVEAQGVVCAPPE
jgi:hypothetical protein